MAKRRKAKRNKKSVWIILLFLVAFACYAYFSEHPFWESHASEESDPSGTVNVSADVSVHFVDVGQGDCIYINAYGKHILIDAGEKDNGQNNVARYLRRQGVTRLDYVIATHQHTDHIGGMQEVIEQFEIGMLIMPRLPKELTPTAPTYLDFVRAISRKGLRFRRHRSWARSYWLREKMRY